MFKNVTVYLGQTIYDIAIQEYGCYEGAFLLIPDNELSLTSDLVAGQQLLVRVPVPQITDNNRNVVRQLAKNKIKPNSGYVAEPTPTTDNNQFTYTLPFNLA